MNEYPICHFYLYNLHQRSLRTFEVWISFCIAFHELINKNLITLFSPL